MEQKEARSRTGGSRVMQKPKKAKRSANKPVIALGAVAAVAAAGYLSLCAFASGQNTFFPGYDINGVDVSGLTSQGAQAKLQDELLGQKIEVYNQDVPNEPIAVVTLDDLGFTTDSVSEWAASALKEQQSAGFFKQGSRYISALMGKHGGAVYDQQLDTNAVIDVARDISSRMTTEPVNSSYEVKDNTVLLTKGVDGQTLDAAELANQLTHAATDSEDRTIYVTFDSIPADSVSVEQIHSEIASEMRNAGYDAATKSIIPEQTGADFDVAAAQKLLDEAAPGETVSIAATIQYPTVTADQLKAVLFRDVLGECQTHVGGTSARISNVKLAASSFNGKVLNTGDVFSYNGTVGQRTAAKGYQAAPAYVQGETVDEIGGGVCQPSSTLYLACLRANLQITERYAHRYVPSYVPKGMDATVSWGGPDYKFTNNTQYPIKLVTSYSGGYLTVKILGTKTDNTKVEMTNKELSTTAWTTVYQDDPTLPAGTEKVKTTPYTGFKVQTFRNVYDSNGKLISSKLEATSDYKVRNKVILKGTGGAAAVDPTTPAPETPTTTPTTPTTPETPPAATTPTAPETPPAPPAPETPPAPPEPETPPAIIVLPGAEVEDPDGAL